MNHREPGKLTALNVCFLAGVAVGAVAVTALLVIVAVAAAVALIRSITGG